MGDHIFLIPNVFVMRESRQVKEVLRIVVTKGKSAIRLLIMVSVHFSKVKSEVVTLIT